MKNFCKRLFLIMAVCLFVVTMAISIVACGDTNNANNGSETIDGDSYVKDNQLTFAEGTTISDILEMFDNGRITSFTMQSYAFNEMSGVYQLCHVSRIYKNMHCAQTFSNGVLIDEYTSYDIYDENESKQYTIINPTGSSLEKEYYWKKGDENLLSYFKTILEELTSLDVDEKEISGFLIDTTNKIIFKDFNVTTVNLPNEYANYKELAVEI